MTNRRLDPDDRRGEILKAAISVSEEIGYNRITRAEVAKQAKCAESLISAYFGTMCQFKRDIMRHAVKTERLKIIAQGIVAGDKHALKASSDVQGRALQSLAS